jgi:hypothetical protein
MGISYTGTAKIGNAWVSQWMAQFCDDVAQSKDHEQFAKELAATLNDVPGAKDEQMSFQIGTWVHIQEPKHDLPFIWAVSNPDLDLFVAKPWLTARLLTAC